MLALTKAGRDRLEYVRDVRRLMTSTFELSGEDVAEQNRIWDEWLVLKRQDWRDLRTLLASDVQEVFRARALAVLAAPRLDWIPFAWSERSGGQGSYARFCFFEERNLPAFPDLSPKLRQFVSELIEMSVPVALHSTDEKLRQTLYAYNRLILKVLEALPEDDDAAARLFDLYQLNDPTPFNGPDEASGYEPFSSLLYAKIPEKWKRLGDERMRAIIRAEEAGESKPRETWERALSSYARHIQTGLYEGRTHYSADIFAAQVDFLLGLGLDTRLFDDWHAQRILTVLSGSERRDLRHRFARHMVFGEHRERQGSFTAYNKETYGAVVAMLAEFGETDPELRSRLERIITDGDARIREGRYVSEQQERRVSAVMAQMRGAESAAA